MLIIAKILMGISYTVVAAMLIMALAGILNLVFHYPISGVVLLAGVIFAYLVGDIMIKDDEKNCPLTTSLTPSSKPYKRPGAPLS